MIISPHRLWLHNLNLTLNVLYAAQPAIWQNQNGTFPLCFWQGAEVLAFVFLMEQTLNLRAAGTSPAAPPGHQQQQEGSKPGSANEVWSTHKATHVFARALSPLGNPNHGSCACAALRGPRCTMSCCLPCSTPC